MRDYLYIWNDPKEQFIVVSGLEFQSFAAYFSKNGALLLLNHKSDSTSCDDKSGFEFVPHTNISELASEDIYSWGNFAWLDYQSPHPRPFPPPAIPPEEIAELLYFAHTGKPLRNIQIPSLGNKFLAYAHDDGWFLRLYYTAWSDLEEMLKANTAHQLDTKTLNRLRAGDCAFWIQSGVAEEEDQSFDVDSIMSHRAKNGKSA